MKHSPAVIQSARRDEPRGETDTRLHGSWLVLARLVCLTLCVLSVGLVLASIPSYFASLHLLCTNTTGVCNFSGQLTPGALQRLQELGLSIDFYATYAAVLTGLLALGYWLVAALLFWRKSDNPLALLAAVALGTFPIAFNTDGTSTLSSPWWQLANAISLLGNLLIVLFLYVFPSGRFVPRWTRWVLIPSFAYWGFNTFFLQAAFNPFFRIPALNPITFLGVIGGMLVVQVYRYRHVSTPTERQQTKWVVYGVTLGLGGFLLLISLIDFFPALFPVGSLVYLICTTAMYGLMLLLPLSISFAVLRSRLWDIDTIINRTLVYGTLTIALALLYIGCVVLLQQLVLVFTGQHSPPVLVIVISTLAVAALFQPLRHRIQKLIDRRFKPHLQHDTPQQGTLSLLPDVVVGQILLTEQPATEVNQQEMLPMMHQQLGNYRLLRLIGQGGFADVYLGVHLHLGTQAAVKVLRTQLVSEGREKFRQEARLIARLEHRHIVRVLEFGLEGNTPFLVMDYAPHGTLRQRHAKGIPLPTATILPYVKQVATALHYAHEQKLVHRDIKPENMLLGRTNQVLLSDFGLAVIAHSTESLSMQEMAGTVPYMSPEQLQGMPRPASDQYSLAIVVYEWLSGDRPFDGSFYEIVTQQLVAPPPPLHEKIPTISPALEAAVLKALAKDPQERFAHIQEFATALEQAAASTQPEPVVSPSPQSLPLAPSTDSAPLVERSSGSTIAMPSPEPMQPPDANSLPDSSR